MKFRKLLALLALPALAIAQNINLTQPATGTYVDNEIPRRNGTGAAMQSSAIVIADAASNNITIGASTSSNDVTIRGGTAGATIALGRAATGAVAITAAGTDQNISITPSGTGQVRVTGNILAAGLGTNGTGALQFPTSIATTGGIGWGSSEFHLYRSATSVLTLNAADFAIRNAIGGARAFTFTNTSNVIRAAINYDVTGAEKLTIGTKQSNSTVEFQSGASATALTIGANQDLTYTATMRVSTDSLSGAGAVSVSKDTTKYTSTGVAQALTLADGADGQIKRILHVVDGGSGVLTPTTKTGFSTVTFTNAGESVTLEFVATQGWIVIGSYGAVIAP